jgi:hypothetical protein
MNVFCITSTINVSTAPWSYTKTRSAWSSQERLDQTVKQLNSIRKYCPNSYIILSEGSYLSKEQHDIILPLVDVFLNDISDEKVYNAIHNSIYKGLGESYELLAGIDYVLKNDIKYNLFFKLGGRISLNSFFDINNFERNRYNFKQFNITPPGYNTVLYSIPVNELFNFKNILIDQIMPDITTKVKGVEYTYPDYITEFNNINTLGVEGFMGITRHEFFSI